MGEIYTLLTVNQIATYNLFIVLFTLMFYLEFHQKNLVIESSLLKY